MKTTPIKYAFSILLVAYACSLAAVQTKAQLKPSSQATDFSEYINRRINENIASRVDQGDPTKQAEPPASSTNSTSLVERSSAPDLLGLGLDFLNLSDKLTGDKKSATPKTITFSAYALKSMTAKQDPLDPAVYNRDRKWRRVSFTLGYDVPENVDEKDPIIGVKWLAINGRDIADPKNTEQIDNVQTALNTAGVNFSKIAQEVEPFIFAGLQKRNALPSNVTTTRQFEDALADASTFPKIRDALTGDEKNIIDQVILKYMKAFLNLNNATRDAVQAIRTRTQIALAFTTTQRRHGRPDKYAGTFTFDKGMGDNAITVNASFLATKTPGGKDSTGGQFAAAFHMPLNGLKPLGYKDPLLLSVEANGKGMTGATPMFVAQGKLTIPLMAGVTIPISVSVANRTEFVKEKEVKGKFGFTFDLSKTLKAFRDGF
jgi:hypothetical protein